MVENVLKPKSFRITDETAEKIKQISNTLGGNLQEAMAKMIEAYEFQASKGILLDKKDDIEQFEKYVTILTRMFMGSLEDNQNISETIRAEYDAMLKSKDALILDLQSKLKVTQELKDQATAKAKSATEEAVHLNQEIFDSRKAYEEKISNLEDNLKDKEDLNKVILDSLNEHKVKLKDTEEKLSQFDAIIENLAFTQDELSSCQVASDRLSTELENLKNKYSDDMKAATEHEKQMIKDTEKQCELSTNMKLFEQKQLHEAKTNTLKSKHQEEIKRIKDSNDEKIDKIKEFYQAKIDEYQQKYMTLMETFPYVGDSPEPPIS